MAKRKGTKNKRSRNITLKTKDRATGDGFWCPRWFTIVTNPVKSHAWMRTGLHLYTLYTNIDHEGLLSKCELMLDIVNANMLSVYININKICNKGVWQIKVITKLPNSEQSYKGKVKTHNYINRQNQSTTGKLWKP
jgi:hypothetical protein